MIFKHRHGIVSVKPSGLYITCYPQNSVNFNNQKWVIVAVLVRILANFDCFRLN